tara:strand:- start:190 stop:966 length:777 start_codon:yes stop_codon:yes gene_type:complete
MDGGVILKILFLGYEDNSVLSFLRKENNVFSTSKKISLEEILEIDPELIVSYGYRYILGSEIVDKFTRKIINLHVSYLPWNRGTYPNVWSIIDNTPSGVSIHFIDTGVDTGDIIFQKKVETLSTDTLESSYKRLRCEIEKLFIDNWKKISSGDLKGYKVNNVKGTYHSKARSERFFKKLGIFENWEITVEEVRKKTDEQIINEIQEIRARNNTHWMDVVKLAFRLSPDEAREIFKKIKHCDQKINHLLKELADNDPEE